MQCRPGCGACCISPSISSPLPGMPDGKAAGVRCVNLSLDNRCSIFAQPSRPTVCSVFSADPAVCGNSREEAIHLLGWLEGATAMLSGAVR
jgi:Fe-S-cluster containining protein